MTMYKVFVYGTLKSGEPNHSLLTDADNGKATFLGKAQTLQKYPLIIATQYNIPFLLQAPGKGNSIQGEVYEVDSIMLEKLDELEGHPEFYVREVDQVLLKTSESDTSELDCWIYFQKTYNSTLLLRNFISDYSSNGDHGLPYIERYNEATVEDYLNEL